MAFHFEKCDVCPCRFKVKEVIKIKVGYYKGNSVIIHYYLCPDCKHTHVCKWDTPAVNKWADKVRMLEWSMGMYRKEPDKYEKYSGEYEVANNELKIVMERVKACLRLKIFC
jgi:hypothetical protein